ncbi:MAG: hypothetical protein Tsb0014_19500 [Pleurocapsa sp.]
MSNQFSDLSATAPISSEKKQRKVMLLEDCQEDRVLYRRYLQTDSQYEYSFVEIESGEEALKLYPQEKLDIILLDYLLPDMDGLEWLRQWQERHNINLPPVIILTGQGNENIAVQFIKLGAVDYLVKDQLTAEKLNLAVNNAIAQLQQATENCSIEDCPIKNIAENKTLEQTQTALQLRIRLQQQAAIAKLGGQALLDVELEQLFTEATVLAAKHLEAEYSKVLQLSEDGTSMLLVAGVGWLSGLVGKATVSTELDSQAGYTLIANEPIVVEDLRQETRFRGPALLTDHQVVSGISTIIAGQDRPFGVLGIHTRQQRNFDGDDVNFVQAIANILATAIASKVQKKALQASEQRFRNTFEQAAVGIAHVAPDGRWLRVNEKLCQIVGYSKEELLQKTFQEITYPDDLKLDLKYVWQMLTGKIHSYSMEKRYIRRDRAIVWVNLTVSLVKDALGNPDYFISMAENISQRKHLELSLQKSLRRLENLHQIDRAILEARKTEAIAKKAIGNIKQLISCQRISIVTFDWEQNHATILATQGQAETLVGNGFQVSLDAWQPLITQLENCDRQHDYVLAYLSQFPWLSQLVPAFTQAKLDCFISFPLKARGKLLGILKVWLENLTTIAPAELDMVSEVCNQVAIALQQAHLYHQTQEYARELEAKVAQRTAQLEEINQELEAFSYSISHDLKAPLRAIQGFALALQEDYALELDDLGREYTERLTASAQQMERLILDLLAYSRLSRTEIQLQEVSLEKIISQAIERLNFKLTRKQAKITIEAPLSNMFGNQTILLQVVSNLLSNALKFVAVDVNPEIRIWTKIKGDRVRLYLSDNGIGIAPPHQERIFGVFERLHGNETYPGTGIGLAIVKKGMERLAGSFGVESELGKGSCFWVEGAKMQ